MGHSPFAPTSHSPAASTRPPPFVRTAFDSLRLHSYHSSPSVLSAARGRHAPGKGTRTSSARCLGSVGTTERGVDRTRPNLASPAVRSISARTRAARSGLAVARRVACEGSAEPLHVLTTPRLVGSALATRQLFHRIRNVRESAAPERAQGLHETGNEEGGQTLPGHPVGGRLLWHVDVSEGSSDRKSVVQGRGGDDGARR